MKKTKKTKKRLRARAAFLPFRRRRPPVGIPVETGGQRIVAMTLAQEMANAICAQPEEREQLIDAALGIGQWLADEGCPGRWDMVRPAAILRCLDYLPADERERFLISFVGLLGHGALSGKISHHSAKRSIEEISRLTQADSVRALARTTATQLQPGVPA